MSVFVPPILRANRHVYVILLRLINACGPPKMELPLEKKFSIFQIKVRNRILISRGIIGLGSPYSEHLHVNSIGAVF